MQGRSWEVGLSGETELFVVGSNPSPRESSNSALIRLLFALLPSLSWPSAPPPKLFHYGPQCSPSFLVGLYRFGRILESRTIKTFIFIGLSRSGAESAHTYSPSSGGPGFEGVTICINIYINSCFLVAPRGFAFPLGKGVREKLVGEGRSGGGGELLGGA